MNKEKFHRIDLSQRLFIELGTALLIETHNNINSLSSKLIGMKVGDYLIVNISSSKSDINALSEKENVIVKYVNQDDIFSFSSQVLTLLNQPDNLVFLKYPGKVESCNIRSHKRVECFLPIQTKSLGLQNPGVVTNISAKGCLCMIDLFESWEKINGQTIELSFSYGDLETLLITGQVKSTHMQGSQVKLGIKFNDVNPFSQSVLTTLVPTLRV
jgi:hypothetical protein